MINQPAPSAEENPQPTDEERKHFAEHNNSRIIKYAEAPSATVDKIIKVNEQTSFTVDNDEMRIVFKDSDGITHVIVLPVKFYYKGNSQQPTVDVDALWKKHSSLNLDNLDYDYLMVERNFKKAIQEALRGSYTRTDDDMIAFALYFQTGLSPKKPSDALTQFTAQRKSK